MVGLYGELKNDAEDGFGATTGGGVGRCQRRLFGFKLGGSVGTDDVGDAERNFFTAGIGYGLGPLNTSITYGTIFDTNTDFDEAQGCDKPYNLVFSADYALAPGLVLAGDVSSSTTTPRRRDRHRRQGLDRGGQRPPGVLIAQVRITPTSSGSSG